MSAAGGYSSLDNAPSDGGGGASGLLTSRDVESTSKDDASVTSPPPSLRSRMGPALLLSANALILLALWRDGRARRLLSQGSAPSLQAPGGGSSNSWLDSILKEYTDQIDDLEGKVSGQGALLDDLGADVTALQEETKDLPTLESITSLAAELHKDEESLQEQADGEVQGALDEVHGLASDVEGAASAAAGAGSAAESLLGDVAELREECDSLKDRLSKTQDREGEAATTIDFEDVPPPPPPAPKHGHSRSYPNPYWPVPNGYRGLYWDNVMVMPRDDETGTGFALGATSGNYIAYNQYGNPMSVSASFPFSVKGFYATPGYKAGMLLTVAGVGKFGKTTFYDATLGAPGDGPVFVDLEGSGEGFRDIVDFAIATSGGTSVVSSYHWSYLVIDDLLIY